MRPLLSILLAVMTWTLALPAGAAPKARSPVGRAARRPPVGPRSPVSRAELTRVPTKELRQRISEVPGLADIIEEQYGDELPPAHGDQSLGKYPLRYTGVELVDGGGDPLRVWMAVVTATPNGYAGTAHHRPESVKLRTHGLTMSTAGEAQIHEQDGFADALLVTAIVEDDQDAAMWLDELDALLHSAKAAAQKIRDDDDDPIDVLHGVLELGETMLGPGPDRPDIQLRRIRAWDWAVLWDREPITHRFLDHKLSVPHTMGGGKYRLFFDVPAAEGRKPRRMVRMRVKLTQLDTVAPSSYADFELVRRYCIQRNPQDECEERITEGRFMKTDTVTYSRRVLQKENVEVGVVAYYRSTANPQGTCLYRVDLNPEPDAAAFTRTLDTTQTPVVLVQHLQGDGDEAAECSWGIVRGRIEAKVTH